MRYQYGRPVESNQPNQNFGFEDMLFKFVNCLVVLIIFLYIDGSEQQDSSHLFYIGPGVFKEDRTRPKANIVFLSQDGASYDGTLAGFATYLIKNASVDFQIWRPIKTEKSTFKLIASYPYTPPPTFRFPNFQDIYIKDLPSADCIFIAKGDRIGIFFRSITWPIPYAFINDDSPDKQKSFNLDMEGKGNLNIGDQFSIDELIFPYQFSMAAWVLNFTSKPTDFNPDLRQTSTCPDVTFPQWLPTSKPPTTSIPRTPPMGYTGATGPTGPQGSQGMKGSTGPIGATGAKGSIGPLGSLGVVGDKGASGVKGSPGVQGVTGLQGSEGGVGATGSSGHIGLKGSPGKNGTNATYNPGNMASPQVSDWRWWRSRSLIIGLYAWSAILSVLIVVVCVCSAILMERVRKEKNK